MFPRLVNSESIIALSNPIQTEHNIMCIRPRLLVLLSLISFDTLESQQISHPRPEKVNVNVGTVVVS